MYRNHNKILAIFTLLFCTNLVFCVDNDSDNSITSKKNGWLDSALLFGAVPLTALGYGLAGTSLAAPLLLFMDTTSLFNTGVPLVCYLGGFSYGLHEGYTDIQNGELSTYSKVTSGVIISIMAIGKLFF